jgi:hypothetical protein
MSERYPRIRHYQEDEAGPYLLIRECIGITFYMRRTHQDIAQAVLHALEVYRRAVGPQVLGGYVDDEGDWQELDEAGQTLIQHKMLHHVGGRVILAETPEAITGYQFTYEGQYFDHPLHPAGPETTSPVSFYLPTEYLEEHGPGRVRELALELATGLPFCSGHAGLSFLFPEALLGVTESLRDEAFRYPGLDIPSSTQAASMGTRVKGVSWLTFLGQPVLGAVGGAAGVRSRLHSPDTTLQELGGERVVITLGEGPEAGNTQQGHTLPAYRELARVLEPWLHHSRTRWRGFTDEDMRRWERRFLD